MIIIINLHLSPGVNIINVINKKNVANECQEIFELQEVNKYFRCRGSKISTTKKNTNIRKSSTTTKI